MFHVLFRKALLETQRHWSRKMQCVRALIAAAGFNHPNYLMWFLFILTEIWVFFNTGVLLFFFFRNHVVSFHFWQSTGWKGDFFLIRIYDLDSSCNSIIVMKHCSVAYFPFVHLNNASDFMQKEIVTSIQFSGTFQLRYR